MVQKSQGQPPFGCKQLTINDGIFVNQPQAVQDFTMIKDVLPPKDLGGVVKWSFPVQIQGVIHIGAHWQSEFRVMIRDGHHQ